ncbi:TlpA disulfide reductase family protein [Rugamonas sp. CCM 8940]|uniref:TlpA disulfide reductase family protein n=1 Tax=Rugamonas sp. CCM 8940 TaxID=2765359 RepID=UPI0018F2CCB8|nr:TlpA disulfide reductase family protein [Rugamonas sp. CCM 8940]MBJ7313327.1 TlpA family protein disulfide reductase [Rugamonas sp. CCM 8940]
MHASRSNSTAWLKPALAAVAIAAVGVAAYVSLNQQSSAPAVTFMSIKGEKITPESLHGKVVMVNFWATSCATCVAEMPKMVETYNKYKSQGLEFVAVAMRDDPPNYVVNYAETRQLPFKVALDTAGDAAKAYGNVAMTPTTFVIDRNGKILKRYVGEPEFPALHKLLEKALRG